MSKYVYPQQGSAVHLISIISDSPPSLSLAVSFRRGGGWKRRAEQSLTKARVSGSV